MSAIAEKIDNCKNYSIFVMPEDLKTISSTKIRESEPLPEFNQLLNMDPFNEMRVRAGRANPIYIDPFETFEKMGGSIIPDDYSVPCNTTEKDI